MAILITMFTKYSNKIRYFLNKCDCDIDDAITITNDSALRRIFTIITESVNKDSVKNQSYTVHKLVTDEYPVIYNQLKKLAKTNRLKIAFSTITSEELDTIRRILLSNNFVQFFYWYIKNQHLLNPEYVVNDDVIQKLTNSGTSASYRKKLTEMLYDNPYVSLDIQYDSEINDLQLIRAEHGPISINLYRHRTNSSDIGKTIGIILRICDFMFKIANKTKKLELNIFMSPIKKKMRSSTDSKNKEEQYVLAPIHINSGSSIKYQFINIWRSEELYKVLIHELVHFLGLDFDPHITKYNKLEQYAATNFNVDTDVKLNEAYTEVLAIMVHTLFIMATMDTVTKIDNTFTVSRFISLFELELRWSIFQVSKIMQFFHFDSFDQILQPYTGTKPHICQTTAVFSYFVVKTAFLFNLDLFLGFVKDGVSFGNRVDEFVELIDRSINDSRFHKVVNICLSKMDAMLRDNNFVCQSLRMSCLEIE